jgi:hypothetical protein
MLHVCSTPSVYPTHTAFREVLTLTLTLTLTTGVRRRLRRSSVRPQPAHSHRRRFGAGQVRVLAPVRYRSLPHPTAPLPRDDRYGTVVSYTSRTPRVSRGPNQRKTRERF